MISIDCRFGGPEHKDWGGPPYDNIASALHAANQAVLGERDPDFKIRETPWIDLFAKIDGSLKKFEDPVEPRIKSFSPKHNRVTVWVRFPDDVPENDFTGYVERIFREVFRLAAERFERAGMSYYSPEEAGRMLDRAFGSIPKWTTTL